MRCSACRVVTRTGRTVPETDDVAGSRRAAICGLRNLSGAEPRTNCWNKVSGTVMADGDLAYPDGPKRISLVTAKTGPRQSRTRLLGQSRFSYFRSDALFELFRRGGRRPKTGYYSYELGKWHIIRLNSECQAVGGWRPVHSEQMAARDLQASRVCTSPIGTSRFSSGAFTAMT